jgi:hypothetical protein
MTHINNSLPKITYQLVQSGALKKSASAGNGLGKSASSAGSTDEVID